MSLWDDYKGEYFPEFDEENYVANKERKDGGMPNSMVKFESAKGDLVQFTAQEVKDRLCPNATDRELSLLMALCQAQRLNPFTNDVYLIKYGDSPAKMVTSKEVFTKRAQANPKFEGMEAGISVINNGKLVRREGSMLLDGETLVGGWCKVYVQGYRVPIFDEVSLSEYSTENGNWKKMPATMIRKTALCHSLREAFPEDFQGLYGSEEMGVEELSDKQQNTASESTKAPQSDNEPMVIEAVEVISDETAQEITDEALKFAELCDRSLDEVMQAVFEAKSVKEAGGESLDALTPEQGEVVLGVLRAWIEKAEAGKAKASELAEQETELLSEDIDF